MASKFKKKPAIKDMQNSGFGTYDEANGGGSPKGGGWGGQDGRVGWQKRVNNGEVKSGEHRESQPRTNDGKFTYNSVNGKETKYESRGKTVNPLLTGGENGIKIDEVEKQFASKTGSLYQKYKDKWYQRGTEMITKEGRKLKTVIAQHAVWDIARVSFNIQKGGFEYEDEAWADKAKAGKRSAEEKAARKKAHQNQEETFVTDQKLGGTKVHQKTAQNQNYQKPQTGMTYLPPYRKLARGRAAKQLAAQATKQAVMQAVMQAQQMQQQSAQPTQQAPVQAPASQLKNTTPQDIAKLKQYLISHGKDPKQVNGRSDTWYDAHWSSFVKNPKPQNP